jgi:hypothetical protein
MPHLNADSYVIETGGQEGRQLPMLILTKSPADSEMMSPGWRAPCGSRFLAKLRAGGQSLGIDLERRR